MNNKNQQLYMELVEILTNCPINEINKVVKLKSHLINVEFLQLINDELNKLEHQKNISATQAVLENWARLQVCLALSYFSINQESIEDFEKVIICCEKALQVYTFEHFPLEWAKSYQILGHALFGKLILIAHKTSQSLSERSQLLAAEQFRIRKKQQELTKLTITCYENTLKVYTYEIYPEEWADIEFRLGTIYHYFEDSSLESEDKAILCFINALKFFDDKHFPEKNEAIRNSLLQSQFDYIFKDVKQEWKTLFANENNYFKEQKLNRYFDLISSINNCSSDEELNEIIDNNQEIIDYNLKLIILELAASLIRNGFSENARLLTDVASQLSINEEILGITNRLELVQEILSQISKLVTGQTRENQTLFSLLQANSDNLNIRFAQMIRSFPPKNDLEKSEKKYYISLFIAFGEIINQFPLENQGDKIEVEIACYKSALGFCTQEEFPDYWLALQMHLANSYWQRVYGNKARNIERTIAYYKNALQINKKEAFPKDWAYIQVELGLAFRNRIYGESLDNLEQSINHYQNALQVYTLESDAENWARTNQLIAVAYRHRSENNIIVGKQVDNSDIEQAIHHINNSLLVITKEADSKVWASLQENLGNVYCTRGSREPEDDFENAAICYENALQINTREASPESWANIQHNLSGAYANSNVGAKVNNIAKAISCSEKSLQVLSYENFPTQYIQTTKNLAKFYGLREFYEYDLTNSKSNNIDKAISLLEEVIPFYPRKIYPIEWAENQIELAALYFERIQGNRAENLEQAITFCEDALQVYVYDKYPERWADINKSLGVVYLNRIKGKRAENLEKAIFYAEEVLQVYTQEADRAQVLTELAISYIERIHGEKAENIEKAISYCEAALDLVTSEKNPELWSMAQHELSIAYFERVNGNKEDNLEKAIGCLENSLSVKTSEISPQSWAKTQLELGLAYRRRHYGRKEDNLNKSLEHYNNALQVFNLETASQDWAMVQDHLAGLYEEMNMLDEAIKAYQAALEVYTPKTFPQECLRIGQSLGAIAENAERFSEAIEGFAEAIDAIETSRSWTVLDKEKQEIQDTAIESYFNIITVCILDGRWTLALEYIERSKARNLVELLVNRDMTPKGVSERIRNELQRVKRDIAAKQRLLDAAEFNRSRGGIHLNNSRTVEIDQLRQDLNESRQWFEDLISHDIQPSDPNFKITQKVESLTFQEIQELLPDDRTVIIGWYILPQRFFVTFVVTKQSSAPTFIQASTDEFSRLVNFSVDYLTTYYEDRKRWSKKLGFYLDQLTEILNLNSIISHLPKDCDRVILVPHSLLHLFPLHALSLKDNVSLIDRFLGGVRYTPSCQLLKISQNQEKIDFKRFLGVQNPTQDLTFTNAEVEAIRQFFQPEDRVLTEKNAKKEDIANQKLNLVHCAHFSCHGYFNRNSPLQSALVLSDALLTLGEIFALDFSQCRLVTLSACETGLVNIDKLSDEYVGLPSGFLYAGSPSVVSSLWSVNDLSTAFLMIKFYENLYKRLKQQGRLFTGDVAIALNKAQIWLRDLTGVQLWQWIQDNNLQLDPTQRVFFRRIPANDKPFKNPFHWAAFCAIGQ